MHPFSTSVLSRYTFSDFPAGRLPTAPNGSTLLAGPQHNRGFLPVGRLLNGHFDRRTYFESRHILSTIV
jgi:hypothetical protein